MDRSFFRYVFQHTWRDQLWLFGLTIVGFPLLYINLELPKRIVNSAIQGKDIPATFLGFPVDQISYLMALSVLLLTLITINGVLKYWVNVYSGVVGERTTRRMRHDLYQRVMRFPLPQFKTMSSGEIIPMIVAETEPVGGFIADAFVLPVFQGGLLATYVIFIFMQDFWLGLAAVALWPPQMWLIPKLQKKINLLAKERVQTARQLSDRIGESVAGFSEIRSNDTLHLERADISERLGRIYAIRFEIYKRKFFVKFLNNFLAQITPFFFYSVGGYLVIKGSLSLGALVAVIAAYKDILSPWKELLTWYSTKEDVRIKYEQIVSQFEPEGLIAGKLLDEPPKEIPALSGEIAIAGLVYSEGGAHNRLDRVSLNIASAEHVALVGRGHSGKDDLVRLIARISLPTSGRLNVSGLNFADVPQAIPGRRIAYATQNAHIFSGTIAHNLFYGLKHLPTRPANYDERELEAHQRRVQDAIASGNSPHDVRADWIDYASAGVNDMDELTERALDILKLVGMDRDVMGYGLARHCDADRYPGLAEKALQARAHVRERVRTQKLSAYVELFDHDVYLANMSLSENLLFGTPRHPAFFENRLAENPEILALLRDVGLLQDLYEAGAKVAALMVELFADVSPDSELFDQYSFISAEDLPEFQAMLGRLAAGRTAGIPERAKARLLGLTFKLVIARHRLGVIDEAMQEKVVKARAEFARRFADRNVVEFLDPDRFSGSLSLQENILFGRTVLEQANAPAKINALVREAASEAGMDAELVRAGLDFEVGNAGSRLSYSERQRLAIARGLMKNPDLLVFNEPTSGLDPATEERVVHAVLKWADGRTVVWALGRAELASEFDRVIVLEDGHVVDDGRYDELVAQEGNGLARLVA
jgi:ABC-type multidrug transport system fused ATPase/permease subunit